MAARENQGYIIGIILLVLLTVILAILTYFAFSQAGSASSQNKKLQEDLNTSNSRLTAYTEQAAILKAYLGLESHSVSEVPQRLETLQSTASNAQDVIDETLTIQETFESDMARFTKVVADGTEKDYRQLLLDFSSTMSSKHQQITQLNNSVELAEAEKKIEIEGKQKELDEVQEQLESARTDLASEQTRHRETETRLGNEIKAAQATNKSINEQFASARRDWTSKEGDYVKEKNDLVIRVNDLEETLKQYQSKRIEIPDGRVLRVAHSIDKVFIDLGSADKLQTRQAFVIFDQNLDTFERGKEKARIEVTKIIGQHAAEARIVERDNLNPILTGDYVMTSTWDPGYTVPIALAGTFDLDGDGKSDLERLISMIRLNNGEVVAYHDENGKVYGEVTKDTRVVVLGDTSPAQTKIINDAKAFEIPQVSVLEYLNSMGVRTESQIMRGTGSLNPGRPFKERQPPRRGGDSSTFGADNN